MATIYNEQRSGGHGNKASLRSRNDAKLAMPLSNLAMEDSNEGTRQHHDSRADDSSGCHGKETGTKPAGGISGAISQSIRSLREFRRNRDFANIILLVVLYWLQGIPLGLANGSVPFLLKEKLSYAEIGMFTLASYPYSIKLVWSPIVDSIYTTKLGRRKSWIVPIQLLVAAMFLWFGGSVDSMMQNPAENISSITAFFLLVVVLSATQDIAVDGWALTLLSEENLSYASTCQTVGLNCGFFLSFTAFLALNSTEFSNKYIWSAPKDHGFLRFGPYLKLWAIVYILVTLYLFLYKRERSTAEDDDLGIVETYKTIWKICKLPHMRELILVLMICKIGFIPNDSVTHLKLVEKGFHKEDMALAVLIDFPVQIIFGYYAARWSQGKNAITPWRYAYMARLFFSFLGMMSVYWIPAGGVTASYFYFILAIKIAASMASTVQFVGISAFFTQIADPVIGGTYMTLVNTLSNFGGTWPVYFVLEFVDWFSVATCHFPGEHSREFTCLTRPQKEQCGQEGGKCVVHRDGYYTVSIFCMAVGLVLFYAFIRPTVMKLEALDLRAWRVIRSSKS